MSPLSRAAAPLLAGAVALSGCSDSPTEIREAAATSKANVTEVSRDVIMGITSAGRFPIPAQGRWRGCRDKAGWLSYYVVGRADPHPDAPTDAALVDGVTAALAQRGYRLSLVRQDGPTATLETVTGEVNVQVTGYSNQPFVLFDISGRCVRVDDVYDELRYAPHETFE